MTLLHVTLTAMHCLEKRQSMLLVRTNVLQNTNLSIHAIDGYEQTVFRQHFRD
jgi:hypothetical protein